MPLKNWKQFRVDNQLPSASRPRARSKPPQVRAQRPVRIRTGVSQPSQPPSERTATPRTLGPVGGGALGDPKDWRNRPDHTTPLSAEALEDLESRGIQYTDQQIALVAGGVRARGIWSGGTTYSIGDVVTGSDTHNYLSLANTNFNHNPVGDGGVWWSDMFPLANASEQSMVPRSVAASSNTIVWVKEKLTLADPRWGAALDGTTDDTTAAQAASTAGGAGAVIELPPATIALKDFQFQATGQRFHGAGRYNTVLKAKAGASFVVNISGFRGCGLSDLTLDGNTLGSGCLQITAGGGSSAQHHSCERVRFYNGTVGVNVPNPGALNQADKNTFYHCMWETCTTGMNIAAPNAQEQVLINPDFNGSRNKAIDISGGTLTIYGGQIQGVTGDGIGIDVSGANVGWITVEELITEGTDTDIVFTSGSFVNCILYLKQCVLSGASYCVDPGTAGVTLLAMGCNFNSGAVGRATSSDFNMMDFFCKYAGGAAYVNSTSWPRLKKWTSDGFDIRSHGGIIRALANFSVPLQVDGASGQADRLQSWSVNGGHKSAVNSGGAFVSDDAAQGIVLKDAASPAHYWRLTIDNGGVMHYTDLGTTRPD